MLYAVVDAERGDLIVAVELTRQAAKGKAIILAGHDNKLKVRRAKGVLFDT